MTDRLEVRYTCCLCIEADVIDIDIPEGWEVLYETTDKTAFCPKHKAVKDFVDAQCPGCVGGWMDCPMWSAFQSDAKLPITPHDIDMIKSGICPRRVNGTFMTLADKMQKLDLSNQASLESGNAFADAILEYMEHYSTGKP